MDYLSRMIEYENLLHEVDIGGEEHLKVILGKPDAYLKRANELRERVSSDSFLPTEDKERILKRINSSMKNIVKNKSSDFWNYALAFLGGMGVGYMLPHDCSGKNEFVQDALRGFYAELERLKKDAV